MEKKSKRRIPVALQSKNSAGQNIITDMLEEDLYGIGIEKKKYIFAYLRKSTNNESQEDSIPTQNARVMRYAQKHGFREEDIRVFKDEGVSGYRYIKTEDGEVVSRPRRDFSAMLKAIKTSDRPCIILAHSVSRLGRNMSEGMLIIEKLGIGYKQEAKIKEVHICGINKDIWTKDTKKTHIQACFNDAEESSEEKSEYMYENIEENLEKDIYPPMIPTPPGLMATRKGLEELETMSVVRRAMEMRIAGSQMKEIHEYLLENDIYTGEKNISTTIFRNKLYIGTFIPKKGKLKGNVYSGLTFTAGKPPITKEFFEKLQKSLGAKKGKAGNKKEGDIIARLLKWEHDKTKTFSVDIKKGKYLNYKNGTFNKSEQGIVSQFLSEAIPKIIRLYCSTQQDIEKCTKNEFYETYDMLGNGDDYTMNDLVERNSRFSTQEKIRLDEINTRQNELWAYMRLIEVGYDESILEGLNNDEKLYKAIELYNENIESTGLDNAVLNKTTKEYKKLSKESRELEKEQDNIIALYGEEVLELGNKEYRLGEVIESKVQDYIKNFFHESSLIREEETATKERQMKLRKLKQLKESKIEEKGGVRLRYRKQGFTADEADDDIEVLEGEIKDIEGKMEKLSEVTSVGEFLDVLPDVLLKIFELSGRVLHKENIEEMRGDLYKLLEITTFELSVTTKKELKIKLFGGIETLKTDGYLNGAPDKNRTCV